ncbi:MAG TPA: UDP-N-acetylmuramate dehydrogenase [Rhizomicrobium sp.]|jgi:UDP-N-acetylmuramate dehydrogenase|nr:UDP-N-acetylmuramate dehydrogenase [Rhizomicrobium sp.]
MTQVCDMLPAVRGTYSYGAPLKDLVWFRAGGAAEILFRPADSEDLATFLAARPDDLRVCVIGVGSNLLVRDGGIPGVTVRLSAGFGKIEIVNAKNGGTRVRAGAAALDAAVARAAADAGIAGLEFLRGVPGTVGGALKMNAGCYGREIRDIFLEATALDARGNNVRLTPADMDFVYRKARVADELIFTDALFEGTMDKPTAIRTRMEELNANREASQPIRAKTGGSTFKNPPGLKAWQLIDDAGCRGLTLGEAQVSQKHTNFLINLGAAKAADIEALGEEVRKRVKAKSGIELEWEIKRVGRPPGAERPI